MDILAASENPISASLSNFAEHHFELDGIKIRSMESFLQSLKLGNKKDQEVLCTWYGYRAQKFGKTIDWWTTNILYWDNNEIDRFSEEYQELLNRAYDALYQNEDFRLSLKLTGNSKLTHRIGIRDNTRTILTEQEFISRLIKLRKDGFLINKPKALF